MRTRSQSARQDRAPRLRLVIPRVRIARRVAELGAEIARALSPRERPVAVVVLQGAFVFAADLLRHLPAALGLEIAFLRCESYGAQTRSKGRVMLLQDLDSSLDLRGRTVLLVDDILDTGLTLHFLARRLRSRGAARIRICALLRRRGGIRYRSVKPEFVGFEVGPEFFVGYGLDLAGKYRHLPDLMALVQDGDRSRRAEAARPAASAGRAPRRNASRRSGFPVESPA
jgi:hypoxanthine phosphoribosyltransferase